MAKLMISSNKRWMSFIIILVITFFSGCVILPPHPIPGPDAGPPPPAPKEPAGYHLDRCRHYAKTAVTQNAQNIKRGCGFTGPEWHSDYERHKQWCLKSPPSAAEANNRLRDEALKNRCRRHGPSRQDVKRCRRYAQTAVTQNAQNIKRGCGFTGPEWHSDYERHNQWCLKSPPSAAESNNRLRDEALKNRCRRHAHTREDVDRCRRYAKTAVSQNAQNIKRGCGFTGPEWHSDYERHNQWCLKSPPNAAEANNRLRVEALKNRCHPPAPSEGHKKWCREYAKRAISQNAENIKRHCGYSGLLWHPDLNAHYKKCINAPRKSCEIEDQERKKALGRCSSPTPRHTR